MAYVCTIWLLSVSRFFFFLYLLTYSFSSNLCIKWIIPNKRHTKIPLSFTASYSCRDTIRKSQIFTVKYCRSKKQLSASTDSLMNFWRGMCPIKYGVCWTAGATYSRRLCRSFPDCKCCKPLSGTDHLNLILRRACLSNGLCGSFMAKSFRWRVLLEGGILHQCQKNQLKFSHLY